MSNNLFRLSLPSAIPSMEKERIIGTRKIRLYPKSDSYGFLNEMIRQQRRAYNLAIACFKEADEFPELRKHDDYKKYNLRKIIRDFVRSEVEDYDLNKPFYSSWVDESVLDAFKTRQAVISKRTFGQKCDYSFKSCKAIRQSFLMQRLSIGFLVKHFTITEQIPDESFGKLTRIIFERGRWFVCAQKYFDIGSSAEIQGLKPVSIDPGVRSFMTAYADDQSTVYGNKYYEERVFPKLLEIDKLYSQRKRCKNDQWLIHYNKKLDKLVNKTKDLIHDLHKRVAYDLVMNYDVILLPKFQTQDMCKKIKRKIKTNTVRSMLGLAHYKFQNHLKWMCKKYGKHLILCNEAYTSKTRSWDGFVNEKLNSRQTISDGVITVDRDINGARGIMLRALYGNLGHKQAIDAT